MIFQFPRTRLNLVSLSPQSCLSRAIGISGDKGRCSPVLHGQTVTCFVRTQLPMRDFPMVSGSLNVTNELLEIFAYGFFFFMRFSSCRMKIKAWEHHKDSTCVEDQNPLLFLRLHFHWRGDFHQLDKKFFSFRK